jgi:hypothetical protein
MIEKARVPHSSAHFALEWGSFLRAWEPALQAKRVEGFAARPQLEPETRRLNQPALHLETLKL